MPTPLRKVLIEDQRGDYQSVSQLLRATKVPKISGQRKSRALDGHKSASKLYQKLSHVLCTPNTLFSLAPRCLLLKQGLLIRLPG